MLEKDELLIIATATEKFPLGNGKLWFVLDSGYSVEEPEKLTSQIVSDFG